MVTWTSEGLTDYKRGPGGEAGVLYEGREEERKGHGGAGGGRAIPSSGQGLCEVRTLSREPLSRHY